MRLAYAVVALWLPFACTTRAVEDDDDGGTTSGTGSGASDSVDPRCTDLCDSTDAACANATAECNPLCEIRVTGVSALCATCLLEGSNGGDCASGAPCCPDPQFPNSVLDCASACEGSVGTSPSGDHPICVDVCADDDPACSEAVDQCFQECRARIQGTTGLCALCLLEDAHGGECSSGSLCCPDATFPTAVTDCDSVCGS